jgi:hypothetical protein
MADNEKTGPSPQAHPEGVNLLNHALFVHALHEKFPEAEKRAREIRKLVSKGIGAVVRSRKSQPVWKTKTLIACLGSQLAKLKDLIEDPEEKEVSWEHPWVETEYPVMLSSGNWGRADLAAGAEILLSEKPESFINSGLRIAFEPSVKNRQPNTNG